MILVFNNNLYKNIKDLPKIEQNGSPTYPNLKNHQQHEESMIASQPPVGLTRNEGYKATKTAKFDGIECTAKFNWES